MTVAPVWARFDDCEYEIMPLTPVPRSFTILLFEPDTVGFISRVWAAYPPRLVISAVFWRLGAVSDVVAGVSLRYGLLQVKSTPVSACILFSSWVQSLLPGVLWLPTR